MTRRAFSQEDGGDLGTNNVSVSRKVQYKDIDLTLAVKPTSGDVYKKLDAASVKQAVKNLIMTNELEKPFRPNYGANLRDLLFELADYGDDYIIEERIINSIERFEPRAEIVDIRVSEVDGYKNTIDTTITFKILNTSEVVEFTTNLARLR
jgi:phage baseplate assembly protein W